MPISAVDTISLAAPHTKRQLLQPFQFWQWTRLAFVGLLAGEMGSGGGFNFPSNLKGMGGTQNPLGQGFPKIDPALLAGLITVIVVTGLVFMLVMMYINSVMRFVLFDSVLTKRCHIREGWSRRQGPGWKYFLWQLGLMVVTSLIAVVLFGIPAALAWFAGWFKAPREHIVGLVLGGIVIVALAIVFFIALAVVHVFTKDFVVPQMALEGIGAVEGWERLWEMMRLEKSAYAVYVGMKIVLAIGASIVVGIVTFLIAMVFAIPIIGVVIATVMAGKTSGLTWNAFTITAAVVAGCILFAIFFYLVALISVPVTVFFPAYAMYFFAARYRALSLALYPPPAGSVLNSSRPEEPPAIPLTPEPIG